MTIMWCEKCWKNTNCKVTGKNEVLGKYYYRERECIECGNYFSTLEMNSAYMNENYIAKHNAEHNEDLLHNKIKTLETELRNVQGLLVVSLNRLQEALGKNHGETTTLETERN